MRADSVMCIVYNLYELLALFLFLKSDYNTGNTCRNDETKEQGGIFMSGPALIIIFLASMVYLFVTIVRFKMNPFFSMISAAIAMSLIQI